MCVELATIGAIGGILGGGATIYNAFQARAQGRMQQKIFNKQAADEREAALAEEARFAESAKSQLSEQAVALAGQGSRIDEGSPLLIQAKSAENLKRDALLIRRSGSQRASNTQTKGVLARAQGNADFAGGLLGGASQLLLAAPKFGGT